MNRGDGKDDDDSDDDHSAYSIAHGKPSSRSKRKHEQNVSEARCDDSESHVPFFVTCMSPVLIEKEEDETVRDILWDHSRYEIPRPVKASTVLSPLSNPRKRAAAAKAAKEAEAAAETQRISLLARDPPSPPGYIITSAELTCQHALLEQASKGFDSS